MTVQNGAGCIGDGFVKVVAVYQYGIKPRNGAFVTAAGTLQKLGHFRIYTGRITSGYGRLAACKTDFTLSH